MRIHIEEELPALFHRLAVDGDDDITTLDAFYSLGDVPDDRLPVTVASADVFSQKRLNLPAVLDSARS